MDLNAGGNLRFPALPPPMRCESSEQDVDSLQLKVTRRQNENHLKEASHEFSVMDCCRANSRLACWAGHERGWIRSIGRYYPRDTRGLSRRLDLWSVGNLAGRRHDWLNHRGIRRCGDFGRDYAADKESIVRLDFVKQGTTTVEVEVVK
jgi:hypothetical protein